MYRSVMLICPGSNSVETLKRGDVACGISVGLSACKGSTVSASPSAGSVNGDELPVQLKHTRQQRKSDTVWRIIVLLLLWG